MWRRPERAAPTGGLAADANGAPQASASPSAGGVPYVPLVAGGPSSHKVKLEPPKTVRCSDPGPAKTPPERCDHITYFEDALSRALTENALCAPATKTGATVSFVMDLDFRKKELKLFRGKSSTLPAAQTKELFACIQKALPTPDWESIPHQHARYVVNVTAMYPPSETF